MVGNLSKSQENVKNEIEQNLKQKTFVAIKNYILKKKKIDCC